MTSMTYAPQWQNNRPALESNGERIVEALKKGTAVSANQGESPPLAPDIANRCFQQLAHSYEEEYGGFRDAPKFPTPGRLGKNRGEPVTKYHLFTFLSLFPFVHSESDVPHVLLVCESLHLRRN